MPLDVAQRWPDLFHGLTPEQDASVNAALVAIWHEHWEPARETVELLTRYVRGEIDTEDAIAEARLRAVLGDQAEQGVTDSLE